MNLVYRTDNKHLAQVMDNVFTFGSSIHPNQQLFWMICPFDPEDLKTIEGLEFLRRQLVRFVDEQLKAVADGTQTPTS